MYQRHVIFNIFSTLHKVNFWNASRAIGYEPQYDGQLANLLLLGITNATTRGSLSYTNYSYFSLQGPQFHLAGSQTTIFDKYFKNILSLSESQTITNKTVLNSIWNLSVIYNNILNKSFDHQFNLSFFHKILHSFETTMSRDNNLRYKVSLRTLPSSTAQTSDAKQQISIQENSTKSTNIIIIGWSFTKYKVGGLFSELNFLYSCWKCTNKNATCLFTANESLVNEAHAVVFHASYLKLAELPAMRPRNQKWIFYTKETPRHHTSSRVNLTLFDTLFNVTATYSSNATVQDPYGKCIRRKNNIFSTPFVIPSLTSKTKTAAWFVSNCIAENKRGEYVKKLQQYIDVDVYGNCGQFRCPKGSKQCLLKAEKLYWFYLAFENNNCKDYVTEKVFTILINKINIVPIVYGGANYSSILPPGSFISAWDYESPEKLSTYLIYLTQNKTAYKEYFVWRKFFVCYGFSFASELCTYLHENFNKQNVIPSVREFWSYETQCPERKRHFVT